MNQSQTSSAVLMVAPTTFGFDEQTAQTNTFQHQSSDSGQSVTAAALREFQTYVDTLRQHDIDVVVFRDTDATPKPNAVFPNNWISTWPDGTVYIYPMATPSRRVERSPAVLDLLKEQFVLRSTVDITASEQRGRILEGTGAIVFDHPARTAYACISPRCDEATFRQHVEALGYKPLTFHAVDRDDTPIYHTNVLLGIQTKTAVLCSASITDTTERAQILAALEENGHQVVDISFAQLETFCGNVLTVQNRRGEPFVVMSQTAYDAFTPEQRSVLATSGQLLPVAIPTIETIGGGSARCMLAEIFLPRKTPQA